MSDGTSVSCYDNLPLAILKSEGWLPLEDNPPNYEQEKEYLVPEFIIYKDKVVKEYIIKTIEKSMFEVAVDIVRDLVILENMTKEEIESIINLYEEFVPEDKFYKKGEKFKYKSKLYEVKQAHTTQSNWKPDGEGMTAIYLSWMPENIVADWELRPSHNTYKVGDVVKYKGELWICEEPNLIVAPDGDIPWNRYWKPYVE